MKPVIGITLGDVNGIGPEVALRALGDAGVLELCTPVIFANEQVVLRHLDIIGIDSLRYHAGQSLDDIRPHEINLLNCWDEEVQLTIGEGTSESGRYALTALTEATDALVVGSIDALVTGPVSKAGIKQHDPGFIGHTEFIMHKCGARDVLMVLAHDRLRVALVTGHKPLKDVAAAITDELVLSKLQLFHASLQQDFRVEQPRIAVLGLNPHAGEQGALGNEEIEHIVPAVHAAQAQYMRVFGPFPADGFFGARTYEEYDGVLAMYHDQGLVPFKALAFNLGVNVTAGLPVVRTSPDHGTGFGIAGKNVAEAGSMRRAVRVAVSVVENRGAREEG